MHFEKVSLKQFTEDVKAFYPWLEDDAIEVMWNNIKLPRRATAGSAGYDFYSPISCSMSQGVPTMIPTGIRVKIDKGYFLMCVPRSGLGFKYGMQLRNSVGIIDEDYANADNEGHIAAKITTEEPFMLDAGDRFMQGIIVRYGTVENDEPIAGKRTGGFGSTGGSK